MFSTYFPKSIFKNWLFGIALVSVTYTQAQPSITNFSPKIGSVGTLVTITGNNLSNFTGLAIGGVAAIPISNNDNTLVAMVMPGATTGMVTIITPGGTANGSSNFTVIPSQIPNTQQGSKLVGTGSVGNAGLGNAIAVSADGNTAIVGGNADDGARGAAWIFNRTGNTWTQQAKLVGTGAVGNANMGYSVAVSADGNTAIIGGFSDNGNIGAAWVFVRNGNSWTQQGNKLVGAGAVGEAFQGISVALSADGNTAMIGGYQDNGAKGAAWVFTRNGITWTQQANKLVGSDAIGNTQFGFSAALSADGNTAILGGYGDNGTIGASWIFTKSGNTWTQQGNKLVGTGSVGSPSQGYNVALSSDGNTAIIGGWGDDGNKGAAWVFSRSGNTWTQQGNKLVGTGAIGNAMQGFSVSLSADGKTAIIGGNGDEGGRGAAWIFSRNGNSWTQQGNKIVGTGIGNAAQGVSSALSANGNTAIIGGLSDDGNKGAAWVFVPAAPTITSFTPTAAGAGAVVTITGTNLTGTTAITLGGTAVASFQVLSSTTISAVVGSGATGALSLVTPSGTATLNGFSFITTPTIANFSPNIGPVGTLVTITGNNLNNLTGLTIGGVAAIPISNDGNKLVAMVMPGATNGGISISTSAGTANANNNFNVVPSLTPNSQQGNKLVGSGSSTNDYQGYSVALSADGNTAIVGGNSGAGAAWIYTRSSGSWTQQAKLTGSGSFGSGVSISADGNTILIGGFMDNSGTGAAWVYTRNGVSWTQQAKLVGTGANGSANQGYSVGLSADGNTAILGGYGDNSNTGAAWIFNRNGTTWTQLGQKLVGAGSIGESYQGRSVGISSDGNTVIIGGDSDNGSVGAAWIFNRSGGTWTQQGPKLVGSGTNGYYQGWSVALNADGTTAILGGRGDNNGAGAAWVFTRNGSTWTQQGNKLVGNGAIGNASQGWSVSVSADGNILLLGGNGDDGEKGAAWVFTRSGSNWTQLGNKLVGTGAIGNAQQGVSLALSSDGGTAIVGGYRDDGNKGAAWVFTTAPPTINSFTPTAAGAGAVITITGTNLTGTTAITLGGIAVASFQVLSSTTISAVVGSGATGALSLVTPGGTATLSGFIYIPTPVCNLLQLPGNLQNGLVAFYPFCGNANDQSGNNYHGIVNNATLTSDRFGNTSNAYLFDGQKSNIFIDNNFFDIGWNEYTVLFWSNLKEINNPNNVNGSNVALNTSPHNGLAVSLNWGGSGKYSIWKGTPNTGWTFLNNNNGTSNQGLTINTWNHVSIVKKQNQISLFINGVLDRTFNLSGSIPSYLCKLYLGAVEQPSPEVFNGKLDDFMIYNRTLSSCEINQIYNLSSNSSNIQSFSFNPFPDTTYSCTPNISLNAGSGYTSYQWSNAASTQAITTTTTGLYKVTVTKADGCTSSDSTFLKLIPCITSFNPTAAGAGAVITITGTNLTGTTAINLGGTAVASFQVLSSTTISAVVGSGATGALSLVTPGGTATLSGFTYIPTPICNLLQLPSNLQNGLVAYYPFCGNANEQISNNNNGTITNAILTADGFGNPNSAYSFNGTNSTIDLPNPFFGGNQVNKFSIYTRVRVKSTANSPNIWGKNFFWGEVNLLINPDQSITLFWANSYSGNKYSNITSVPSVINLNQWHDIVVTYENSIAKIYVDGINVQTNLTWSAQGGTIISNSQIESFCNFAQDPNTSKFGTRIVSGQKTAFLNGDIDDFRLYNRSLSSCEVTQLYNLSLGNTNNVAQLFNPFPDTTYSCTPNISLNAGSGYTSYQWSNAASTQAITTTTTGLYKVTVTKADGCTSSDSTFLKLIPCITSFNPTAAGAGAVITITGNNLIGTTAITLGGTAVASFQVLSSTTISAVVGSGATGALSLVTPGGSATLSGFSFIPAPTIANFSPNIGPVGTLVTITGNNLNNLTGLTIAGVAAIPISNDGNKLVAMVMPGATNGGVGISTIGGSTNGNGNFKVIPSSPPNTQQGSKLVGSGAVGNAQQGDCIAISADGNTAIVGGWNDDGNKGAIWIFARSGSIWTQQGNKLVGTGAVGNSRQGTSVAISADGNTVLTGGIFDDGNKGAAWVFTRSGNTWSQQGNKLVGTGAIGSAEQGRSVAISADGNTAIIGGQGDDGNKGAAWVFTRSGSTWIQQGNKLVGSGAVGNASQGYSVALSADGNTVVVGGQTDDGNKGAVWVFTRSGNSWTQQGSKLVGSDVAGNAIQGYAVAVSADGNTAISGGYLDSPRGAAWVFTRSGGIWTQQGSKLVGTGFVGSTEQGIGVAVSADGNTAIIGGRGDNGNQGAAWIFTRSAGTWTQRGSKLVGTGAVGSALQGDDVALSADGNTAIVGGNRDDSNKGAAWVFTTAPPTISSFTPTAAGEGAVVTITGTNLTGTTAITLGGTAVASFQVLSSTTISAVVGSGATGALSLVTPGGTATLSGFTYIPTPICNLLQLPSNLQNGLVAYYPFCGNANDQSGNGYNGTVNNATLTTDRFGNSNAAYNFNGVSGTKIETNYQGILGDTSRTISVWVRRNVKLFNANYILMWGSPSLGNAYALFMSGNADTTNVGIDNGGSVAGRKLRFDSVSDSKWHNYTITYNRLDGTNVTNVKIYIDGKFVENNLFFNTQNINTTSQVLLRIGEYITNDPRTFLGDIDDVMLYRRSLSSCEVAQLYNFSSGNNTNSIQSSNYNPFPDTTYSCTPNISLNAGSGYTSYQWSNAVKTQSITTTSAGFYKVTVTSADGCSSSDSTFLKLIPCITSFTPTSAGSGAAITITGTNLTGTTSITLGGTSVASFRILSSTTISAVVGNGTSGALNLTSSGGTASLTGFTYIPLPICNLSQLPNNLQSGLVAFYPFCGNANDQSGNNNNGVINNAVLSSDRFGTSNSAFTFNGINSSIKINSLKQISGNGLAMSVWIKPNNLTANRFQEIYRQESAGGNLDFLLSFQEFGTILSFGLSTKNIGYSELDVPISPSNYVDGKWHHIVITYDGKLKRIYVDNKLVGSGQKTGLVNNSSNIAAIGSASASNDEYFNGLIDDLFAYDRPLSVCEIGQLFNSGPNNINSIQLINYNPFPDTTYACTPEISLNAGTGYTSYQWSNAATTQAITTTTVGNYKVIVTNAEGCTASDSTFLKLISCITSFTPTSASSGGKITVTGTNLLGTSAVTLGGVPAASFEVLSSTTILVVVGSGASGAISLVTAENEAALNGFIFIPPPPTISSFTPTSARTGSVITITGTNLLGTTAVSLGGTSVVSFTVVSATTINAIVGSGSTGALSLITPGGSATMAGFNYIPPPPIISSFTPVSAGAGAVLAITGNNLIGTSAITLGGTSVVSFTVVSATTISAIVGSGSTGALSLVTPGGSAAMAGFSFIPAPTITSFTPSAAGSGAVLTISGNNFNGTSAITLGGISVASFTVVSASTISAIVGSGSTGALSLVTPGGSATLSGFRFIPAPTISSFTPTIAGGAAPLIITGTNFDGTTSVTVGGTAVSSFTVLSPTSIRAIIGNGSSGSVSVVTLGGQAQLAGFTFVSPNILISLQDSIQVFGATKGNFSKIQNYSISGNSLQGSIQIESPDSFQISQSPQTGFAKNLVLNSLNGTLESTNVYIRFKSDLQGVFSGSLVHSSTNAVSKSISLLGSSNCDSTVYFTPIINNVTKDTIICFNDSILLSSANGLFIAQRFNFYRWNTGETTRDIIVKNSGVYKLQVGLTSDCMSNYSVPIRLNKNSNATPKITLSSNNLVSTNSSNYRWYYNNILIPGASSNLLKPSKVGFYTVETSNDSVCWEKSIDFALVAIPGVLPKDSITVKIYPNPSSTGLFHVVINLINRTNMASFVTIVDASGAVLLQTSKFIFFGREIKIPIMITQKGTFYARVDVNGVVKIIPVIIQ